jgi:ABC-type transport system involved in cytochrome bd biosynthesis fused ATPase/permease subunit
MVALFRIEELTSGAIFIDGVDISRVNVHYLRSKLAIIPQESVLFSASLRFNLDPFNECTDAQLWEVLRDVNMEIHVNTSLPLKLEEPVSEGGDNFSTGQRQVIQRYNQSCLSYDIHNSDIVHQIFQTGIIFMKLHSHIYLYMYLAMDVY